MKVNTENIFPGREEINQLIESHVCASEVSSTEWSDHRKKKLVTQVLAMIARFVSMVRSGQLSPMVARRRLLDLLAMVIGLGLEGIPMIMQGLIEAKLAFSLYCHEDFSLAMILGAESEPSLMTDQILSLLFLTKSELQQLFPFPEKPLAMSLSASEGNTFLQSLSSQPPAGIEALSSTQATIKQMSLKDRYTKYNRHQVNHLQDSDIVARNIPALLERKKKRIIH